MTKKTGTKWKTKECGRCGEPHNGYSGKLDHDGIEYVVCGTTNKRLDVKDEGTIRQALYKTIWTPES